MEIPDPDASFGLSCRETEGTGELLPEMGWIEASALGSQGESREVKNGLNGLVTAPGWIYRPQTEKW